MPYDTPEVLDETGRSSERSAEARPSRAEAPDRVRDNPAAQPTKRATDDRRETAPDREPDDRDGDAKGQGEAKQKRRSPWIWIILAVVVVAAIVGGVLWWLGTKDLASTDDAYTNGRAVLMTPKVSGYVTELRVDDNQRVRAGDTLLQIDMRDYLIARDQARATLEIAQAQKKSAELGAQIARKNFPARLAQAEAQLASARAALVQAQAEYSRQHGISRSATTQQNVDQSTASLRAAEAQVASTEASVTQAQPVQQNIDQSDQQTSQVQGQVDQARAQLDQAELNLSYTKLVAPQDGWVTKRNVERGNYATPGTSVMSLVGTEVWVTANFKESQLSRMRPGQPVDIKVDAYPVLKLKGHVDSVQLGSGNRFSAFPAENATGNFVKIVQRVPVKIVIDSGLDPALPLPLGISVVPTVRLQ